MKKLYMSRSLSGTYKNGVDFILIIKDKGMSDHSDHLQGMALAEYMGWSGKQNVETIHSFSCVSQADINRLVGKKVGGSSELLFEIRGHTAGRVYWPLQTKNKFFPLIGNADLALLRKQKLTLVKLADDSKLSSTQRKAIDGVVGLLDSIQGNLVDDGYCSEKEVFNIK